MLSAAQIAVKVDSLKARGAVRDAAMKTVFEARHNRYMQIAPDMLPDGIADPMVANSIDVFARDIAEKIAPLPTINCSSGSMVSDRAKTFADKRTKIAHHYTDHSRLETQMYSGADWYVSFSTLPFYVEPDFDAMSPRITLEFPIGCYPEYDRWGNCISMAKRMTRSIGRCWLPSSRLHPARMRRCWSCCRWRA